MWFATMQRRATISASQCTRSFIKKDINKDWSKLKLRLELHAQAVPRAPVVMLMGSVPLPSLKSGHTSFIVSVSNQNYLLWAFPTRENKQQNIVSLMSIYKCIIDADVLCCVCVLCIFNILTSTSLRVVFKGNKFWTKSVSHKRHFLAQKSFFSFSPCQTLDKAPSHLLLLLMLAQDGKKSYIWVTKKIFSTSYTS